MTNRITETFQRLHQSGKKALIPYIMAGDGGLDKTEQHIEALVEAGVDMIELGIPFSDPMADGPTIQRASERALQHGVTLRKVLAFVKRIHQTTTIPLIAMTYYNPVFKYGLDKFVADATEAGIDGVIIPDLIPDEAEEFIEKARQFELAVIFLLAPTSNHERIEKVVAASTGFIYYVSITGITGAKLVMDEKIQSSIQTIKQMTDTPVAVGFGISNPEEAAWASSIADGVIVGSAIVKLISQDQSIKDFVISLRKAVK